MGSVAIVCAFIVLSASFQDARGKKPSMFPAEDTLLVGEHNELRINCYSKGAKLQFSFPETTAMIPRSNYEILPSENGTYTFLRSNALPSDTGWYACAEEGIEIDNHFRNLNHTNEDVSWIYIYVKPISKRPFVNNLYFSYPKTIIVVPGSTVVVPCRPTSPQIPVQLWQNLKPLVIDGTTSRFDPRIGLIMTEVDFENGEAIIQCGVDEYVDNYILRLSSTKPTMITAGSELTLQEGDELKIECYSPTKLSFLFPEKFSNSSEYEISVNKRGVNTFLRRSAVMDDTGWYGCAGAGEGIQNDIPYHSINYTKKEISWIYIYVNSTVPITSERISHMQNEEGYNVIPCRPTSPGLHIRLNCNESGIFKPLEDVPFDPKLGFVFRAKSNFAFVCYCTADKPGDYVSKPHNLVIARATSQRYPKPTIVDAEDPLASENFIIRMTGEDLELLCETFSPERILFRLEWTVPNTVLERRVQYNRNRTDGHFDDSAYWRGEKLTMTIKNISESDSGEYICTAHSSRISTMDRWPIMRSVSRYMEVFDKHGGRYIKLDKQGGTIQVSAVEGETVKWLLDVQDFPSAQFSWYNGLNKPISDSSEPNSSRQIDTISRRGSPYVLFTMRHLGDGDGGRYRLSADIGNMTAVNVSIILNVKVPPVVTLDELYKDWYAPGERLQVICYAHATPHPNKTLSFLNCPKYPSEEDSNRTYLDSEHVPFRYAFMPLTPIPIAALSINISGILRCEACNEVKCSLDEKIIMCAASNEPYFTSTNLNHSEVNVNLETVKNDPIVLECYVAGRPYPKVTWFKDNIPLQESRQFKFAYDNRELSILYFVDGNSGRYMCRAENENGKVENYIDIKIAGALDVLRSSLLAAAAVLLGIIVVSWVVIWKQRKEAARKESINSAFKNGALDSLNPDLPIVDQAELLPYDMKWEFPRELLTLDKILGSGAFGIVKKATAKSICRGESVTTVAVKLVRSKASLNFITALTRELKILVYLGKHINVVNLLGACTQNVSYGELFVIVEYCQFGNLHDYLCRGRTDFIDQTRSKTEKTSATDVDADRIDVTNEIPNPNKGTSTEDLGQHTDSTTASLVDEDRLSGKDLGNAQDLRSKYKGDYEDTNLEPISTRDLIYWSWQVSRGMDYLGKRKIVHGDLAARNILLADNGIVKISDFGLSKALYEEAQYRDEGVDPLPVKWMAPESIKDRVFSYQSDIWSFGIVMWEFFTLAKTPYPGIRPSELYYELINGHRMEQPEYAVTTIYDTMLNCWESDPSKRPSFVKLGESISDLLDEGFKTRYLEINSLYLEIDARIFVNEKKDYLTLSPSTFDPASSSVAHEQIEMKTSLPLDECKYSV